VAFADDGRRVVSAGEDRTAIVWDAATGREEAVLLGHSTRLMGAAFLPGGGGIVSSDQDGEVIVWDRSRRPRLRFHATHAINSSYCLAVSPDGRWVTSGRAVNRSDTGERVADLRDCDLWGAAFSPDGRWLAVPCSRASGLELLDTRTWQPSKSHRLDPRPVTLAFSPDSRQIVTGDDMGRVRLFDVEPLREVALLGRHTARIKSVAFSPDGRRVASAADDKAIALWDVDSPGLATRIGTHGAPVLSVAFSPDGRRLVSGGHDSLVRLYTRHSVRWGRRLD
jgi:WD40 repeat protein